MEKDKDSMPEIETLIEEAVLQAYCDKQKYWTKPEHELSASDVNYIIQACQKKLSELETDNLPEYAQLVTEKLQAAFQNAEIEKGAPLEEKEILYLKHFWLQHIEKNGLNVNLCYDNYEQIYYPIQATSLETRAILNEYPKYIQNFDQIVDTPEFATWAEEVIQNIHNGKNVTIFVNHTTVASLPIVVALLDAYYKKKFNTEEHIISQQSDILLGGSLTTRQDEREHVTKIANCHKVHPTSKRGTIIGLEEEQKQINVRSSMELMRRMKNKSAKGRLLIVAPSGTQDTSLGNKVLLKNTALAHAVIQSFIRLPNSAATIFGENSFAVYGGREKKKGSIYVKPGDFIDLSEQKPDKEKCLASATMLQTQLAQLVPDQNGNPIGSWE